MKRMLYLFVVLIILLMCLACTSNELSNKEVVLPENIPDVVQKSDFTNIDWERKTVQFGDEESIGNENKSGVIGANTSTLEGQKWMWHLWGTENTEATKLTVVGFHKKTGTIHQIITTGWTADLAGTNNGAESHAPSFVQFPEVGEWAVLLYTNDKLFDILVFDIHE